jgi:hypothetical protein
MEESGTESEKGSCPENDPYLLRISGNPILEQPDTTLILDTYLKSDAYGVPIPTAKF